MKTDLNLERRPGEPKPRLHQSRPRSALKLLSVALATLLSSLIVARVILGDGLGLLALPCCVPFIPPVVMFGLALFDQRTRIHVTGAILSTLFTAVPTVAIFGNFLLSDFALGFYFVFGLFATWVLATVGSVLGIACSRREYTIVFGKPGHCPACGYCLKGLPTNTCPECGREFTADEAGEGRANAGDEQIG